MDTWTKQRSFPIVTVTKINNSKFKISQESFLLAKAKLNQDETNTTSTKSTDITAGVNDTLWQIPFAFITDQNRKPTLMWFKEKGKKKRRGYLYHEIMSNTYMSLTYTALLLNTRRRAFTKD